MEVFLFSPPRVNEKKTKTKQKQNSNDPLLLVELGIFHPVNFQKKKSEIMTETTSNVNSVKCFAINIP